MEKFDFVTTLQHEINVINRAMSLRPLDDDENQLLSDYELFSMGLFPFSELKAKYLNRYFNVR